MARNEYDDLLGGNVSYDGILENEQQQKDLAVKRNLTDAIKVNPEIYSKTRQLSNQTGIPTPLVERNMAEVENRVKVDEYDSLIKNTGALKDNMTDQDFAKLASDDLRSLVTIDEMLSRKGKPAPKVDMSQGFAAASQQLRKQQDQETEQRILNKFMSQGADNQTAQNILSGLKVGRESLIKQGAGSGQADYWFSQQVLQPIGQIKTSNFDFDTKKRFEKSNPLVRGAAKGITMMEQQAGGAIRFGAETLGLYEEGGSLDRANQDLEGRMQAIGDSANPFDRNLENAFASIVSQAPGLVASVGTGTAVPALASMFVQVAGQEFETGRRAGLEYGEASTRAAIFGAAEVVGEKFGLGDLIKGLRGAAAGMPTQDVLSYIAKEVAKQIPGEQLTTAIQFGTDLLPQIGLNQDATAEEYIGAVMDTLVQTVMQGGIMSGTGVAISKAAQAVGRRYEEAQADIDTADLLNEVMSIASQSNLRARDTGSFAQLVQQAAELGDSAPNELYVPANILQQALQQANLDASVLPSVAGQLDNSALTGADVVVPVGELASAFSGTTIESQLLDQSRFSVDGQTIAEQRQFLQEAQDRFSEEAQKITEKQAQLDDFEARSTAVFDQVLGDLNTAKRYSADVNNVLADLVRKFYVIQSDKLGTTPDALYQQFPLRVQGESINTGEVFEQDSPEFKAWFGDSKVVDEGGKPMVMYHGTDANFDTFQDNTRGVFFVSPSAEWVSKFRTSADGSIATGENVMPVYISSNNPFDFENRDHVKQLASQASLGSVAVSEIRKGKWARLEDRTTLETIKRLSFDGLYVKENGVKNLAVFNQTQIKSAVGNRGTFDPKDPNILNQDPFSQSDTPAFKAWAGTDEVIESNEINSTDFRGEGPFVVKAFHGTTNVFNTFDASIKGNMEGQYGAVNYFTSSEQDATDNYAGEGPDLTSRIEQRAERLADDILNDYEEAGGTENDAEAVQALKDKYGEDVYDEDMMTMARNIVRQDLNGGEEIVMEVFVKTERPFVVGDDKNSPWYEFIDEAKLESDAIERVAENEGVSVEDVQANRDDYEDQISDARYEIMDEQENPLIEAIQTVADRYEFDPSDVMASLYEITGEGSIQHSNLETQMRELFSNAYIESPETGELISSQVLGDVIQELGFDAIILKNADKRFKNMNMEPGTAHVHVFDANNTNIKSVDNLGTFDPNDPNIYNQDALGTFDPNNFIITLNQGANLSTFLHEVGHFFLEVQAHMASDINAPEQVRADMGQLLKWFGVKDLQTWRTMTLNEQRPYHEQFARGFEAYLFEGNAPNAELQSAFQRFRDWLTSVYASLRNFVESYGVELTPEVREVMDRMIATDEQISAAKERRAMVALFTSAEEAGMTDEEFAAYQQENEDGTQDAIDTMNKRSLADIKWLRRARSKAIQDFQKEGEAKRSEARIEARRQVLSEPVYQAWNFLSGKEWGKVTKKEKANSKDVDPTVDSVFTAIAKLGGINRAAAISEFGLDIEDIKGLQPVFGKPVFRKEGGASIDSMAENLSQYGYLNLDQNGKYELAEFEDMIMQELRGEPYYSYAYDYQGRPTEESERDLAQQLPAGRLNLDMVKGMLGKDFEAAKAKIGRMLSSDGLHPDIVADLFRYPEGVEGFASGRDLVNKLLEATPPGQAIEALTDQIVLERYGDITSDKAAQEAADEALHNEAMLRSAATEMKAIGSMTGSVTAMAKAAKDAAKRAISRVAIKDLRPNKYAAAAMRASREAETAIKKKDMQAAIAAKRNQLLNIAMTQQAYEAQASIRKSMQEFARLKKADKNLSKTHDINLVDTARSILSAFGVNGDAAIGNPILALEPLKKVQEYNPDLYAVLEPIATAAMIASQDERGNAVNYQSLTVEGFNGLRDTIRQIMHQARAEKQITVDGKRVDISEANAALIEQLDATGAKPTDAGVNKAVTDKERTKWTLSGLRAGLRRMEAWVESQDLGNFKGAFHTYLFNQVMEGTTLYRNSKNYVLRQYVDLLQAKEKEGDFTDTKLDATAEIGYTFEGKKELLGALLHTGNEGNMRKLLLGRGWAELVEVGGEKVLDTTKWDAMVARMVREGTLTKSDYDFLQATWDLMDSIKADAQQAHFYLYGYYFDEVTNTPFMTPFGEYRGGYAPAKADTELVPEAAIRAGVNEIEQDFNFLMPSTGNGFTKGRVNYNKPLVMDLRLVAQHIDSVLRFTYIQPAITDTLKLVKRGEFANKLHSVDPQVTQSLILPWLSRAASQTVTTPFTGADGKALQRFFTAVRRNTGMMIMTANFVNALQQLTGFSLTAVKVEGRYIKSAFARYIKSPVETANAVAEQSDWMRIRLEDQSFEMQKQLEQIMLGADSISKGKSYIQRHAYFAQRAMQNFVDTVSWAAAYDKAIGQGMEEDSAVKYADGVVRQTQGSLLPEDISRFESGNAFIQLFTQFASYFNMQANLLGSAFANTMRTMGAKKGAGNMLYIYTMGFMIPALMADAIVRTFGWDWDDEDDDGYLDEFMAWFVGGQVRTGLAMFPGVGQAGILFINRFNDNFYDDRLSTSPAIGAIENAAGAPLSAYKAVFEDGSIKKAVRDSLGLLSLITGVPFSALSRPLGYAADYAEGKVEPANELDAIRGVVSGKGREEERR